MRRDIYNRKMKRGYKRERATWERSALDQLRQKTEGLWRTELSFCSADL
jgi:hypothetical protein